MSPVTLLLIAVFFFRLAFWYADLSFYQNWFGYKRICVPNCADVLALDFFWFFSSFPSLSYIAKILLMDCVKAARLSQTSYLKYLAYYIFFGTKKFHDVGSCSLLSLVPNQKCTANSFSI